MDRIHIGLEADRLTVASILVKNKYTVRQGSQRRSGSRSYDYYLEYEPNQDKSSAVKEVKDGD